MLDGLPQVHPAIVLVLGAVAVAALPRRFGPWLFVAVSALAGLATLGLVDGTTWHYDFYGFDLTPLRVDGLSLAFSYVFAIALLAGGIFGMATMGTLERTSALVYAASAFGVVFAGDVVTLFFFWELKVSASTLLVFARRTAASSAAALRYLFVNLAGGIVLLAGIVWWVIDTGSVTFGNFGLNGGATILILIGFCVAAAAVPLHAWMPDAYPASTIAGTVFLAAFTSKAAVYALARGFPGTSVLIWVGVVMALYGVVFALSVNDIRRVLVYSSVSQGGFMLAAIGVGTEMALNGAVAHAFAHIVYKGLLLMAAGAVLWSTGHSRLTQLGGLGRAMPWVAGLYLVGAASIGSIPLFSGYVTKEMATLGIEEAGFHTAYWLLKLASVGTLFVVAFRLPWFTWFAKPAADANTSASASNTSIATGAAMLTRKVTPSMYVAMGALAVVNIAIGVAPNLVYDVLPFAVDYSPFKTYRVVNAVALAAGAAVAFWLVRTWLVGRPVRVVDTDWVYRDLPRHLAPAVGRLRMPEVHMKLPTAPGTPVWASTLWVSGAVVIVTFVVVLAIGVTS